MNLTEWFNSGWSASWLWAGYVAVLQVTVFLALMELIAAAASRQPAAFRSQIRAFGLLGVLLVPLLAHLPIGGFISILTPDAVAQPLIQLGAATLADDGGMNDVSAWLALAAGLWLMGAVFVLGRLGLGWLVIRNISRHSAIVTEERWGGMLGDATAGLGIRRRVALRRVAGLATPLTWGTLQPIILLPENADSLPDVHRRAVLLHELAHVRRRDCLVQITGQISCALFWFHPGIWWTSRRLQVERELACDAEVLRAGVRPSDYAECLLSIADCARPDGSMGSVAVSVGVARPTRLKERVQRIILGSHDSSARRSSRWIAATIVSATVVTVGSARLHFTPSSELLRASLDADRSSVRAFAATALAWRGLPVSAADESPTGG